jgi:type II secretory pathway pseudopilin PulG
MMYRSRLLRRKCRAFSLVEVVASTMIVGLLTVVALDSLGAATRSADSTGDRAVAAGLAEELMAEILQTKYSEPSGSATLGRDAGETAGLRSTFDDVDDYTGWNECPPKYRDGTKMADRDDLRQTVQVTWVVPTNLRQTSATDQGAKRIIVTIKSEDIVLAQRSAVRTNTD